MAKERAADKVERLQNLAPFPKAQVDYALRLVETERHPDVSQAALDVLAGASDPRVRATLLERYTFLEGDPTRRDAGCFGRAAILKALRDMARQDDAALLERAVSTYEFLPPGRLEDSEVAAGLRSVALVTLNEIDETLAAYHAVRLLHDRFTSRMSGEPAVTAAQVLASQGHALPLYAYVLGDAGLVPEVVAECLRHLTAIPTSLLAPLVDRYVSSEDELILLGLFDLLLAHEAKAAFATVVLDFLRTTSLTNMYRYLVNTVVADRRVELIEPLYVLAQNEQDRDKATILREALALL
ncbi:MAG: hypothetical protein JOZ81_20110 [Chloroflexi bacterium]|nr:hypothetical protein [Chloroflexota bacterium]